MEVLTPSNTDAEIQEEAGRYFDAGAREVWVCAADAAVSFLGPAALQRPRLCPAFPERIQLRQTATRRSGANRASCSPPPAGTQPAGAGEKLVRFL